MLLILEPDDLNTTAQAQQVSPSNVRLGQGPADFLLLWPSNDLWARAAAELSDEEKSNINFSRPDKLNVLSDLLELTEQSRQECIRKRWRYTRKSGETVIFMDLFSKVVKWIDIFKQVGDAAVQYDPVHAALPWAGVRFLLQVCIIPCTERKLH
jgi:hypothetical protein